MLVIRNLTKKYSSLTAVKNVSFEVDKGTVFGLLGPNGAGKTTIIRTILNILKPSSGEIHFEGQPISKHFLNQIGYLPEERGLYKKSRVIDVIRYFASLKNIHSKESHLLANYWLKKLDIIELKDKKVEELSKGNQQKVQFITAVLHNPKLLILDEPFSGFDPINQEQIKENIHTFKDEGKIIILSTHQMETAEKLCTEILLLNEGESLYCGSVNTLKRQFGENMVKVEFSGSVPDFTEHPDVVEVRYSKNGAYIKLNDSSDHSQFLRSISSKYNINSFNTLDPSLHKIFIEVIQRGSPL